MTPESQRTAIAEACGWLFDHTSRHAMYYVPSEDIHIGSPVYDLNAMHEAWQTLTPSQKTRFESELYSVIIGRADYNRNDDSPYITNATAAQRAEAFLRTIGKWTTNQNEL